MSDKPSYEDLEKRIQFLEQEHTKRKIDGREWQI